MFAPAAGLLLDSAAQAMAQAFPKPTPEKACAAMDQVFALADQSWDATRNAVSFRLNAPPMACKAGCGWCCHQQVGVTVVEAIRLADHVRRLPAAQSAALTQRVRDLDQLMRGKTTSQRAKAKLPCAFLVDGACSVYAARPLRCRGPVSIDVGFCVASFEDEGEVRRRLEAGSIRPALLDAPQQIYDQALNGVLKTLHFAKLADYALELTAGVRDLLDKPERAASWLRQKAAPKACALVPDPGADVRGQFR